MSITLESLLATALELPEEDRLRLAGALLAASEPPTPKPIGEAWVAELQRRSREAEAGQVVLSSWEEVKRRAREQREGHENG